jgi:hypothetical protein
MIPHDELHVVFGTGPVGLAEMLYEFNEPFVVDSSKFVQAFGDIATFHHKAVRQTLEWYRLPAQTKAA